MHLPKQIVLLLTHCFLYATLPAQAQIPAFTGYGVPAEVGTGDVPV